MPSTATTPAETKLSPRERLLDAATELFYAEGVQSVGIDRVIERAGVAKASLYSTFGSKEALVEAYLERRHAQTLKRLRAAADSVADPVEKILAVYDAQARQFGRSDFRGCAFTAASAEAPEGGRIDHATHSYRDDIHELFKELGEAAGATDPEMLASQLQLIYDGSAAAAKVSKDAAIATPARAAIMALLDVAIPGHST